MRFAVLRHYGSKDKEDHHDVLLEVTMGDNEEDLALDKLECSTLNLRGRRLTIDPQGLIRRRYLTYEGPMMGDRGSVQRVDSGRYILTSTDTLKFEGGILNGEFSFQETNGGNLNMCKFD